MATRNGKIANLPNDVREQLNFRLLDGETGRELAAWLNSLPEVQSVLGLQFNGSPVSEVNLTHWRQGGYLQWLTERECFESAHALAAGDCDLAKTGLSAERLFNILTLRYGELLMRWDFCPEEGASETAAFSQMAKKARILQTISRSVLAIHRAQSQPQRDASVSTNRQQFGGIETPARPNQGGATPGSALDSSNGRNDATTAVPIPPSAQTNRKPFLPHSRDQNLDRPQGAPVVVGEKTTQPKPSAPGAALRISRAASNRLGAPSEILSGSIAPSPVPLNLSQIPFKGASVLADLLDAV